MTVYRIQSRQDRTRGAYRSHVYGDTLSDIVRDIQDAHGHNGDIKHHPMPSIDVGIKRLVYKDEHCGFNSAAALLRWFRGFIPDLLRAGYEIVALRNVTITAIGEYQVLFKWND